MYKGAWCTLYVEVCGCLSQLGAVHRCAQLRVPGCACCPGLGGCFSRPRCYQNRNYQHETMTRATRGLAAGDCPTQTAQGQTCLPLSFCSFLPGGSGFQRNLRKDCFCVVLPTPSQCLFKRSDTLQAAL